MKNFIVFDLEWNQNPGGKEASVERLPFEIFEIGAVKLNEEREKVAEFHRIIRPCVYRQMHRIISEVTHVSIEELERDGEPFAAVMEDFLKWCGEDCIFCTWGSMDLTELQRNMVYHGMTIPFPKPFLFYDVQKLYSLCYQDGKARISLDEAVESFALDVDAPFHRALGDAEYTGRVYPQRSPGRKNPEQVRVPQRLSCHRSGLHSVHIPRRFHIKTGSVLVFYHSYISVLFQSHPQSEACRKNIYFFQRENTSCSSLAVFLSLTTVRSVKNAWQTIRLTASDDIHQAGC